MLYICRSSKREEMNDCLNGVSRRGRQKRAGQGCCEWVLYRFSNQLQERAIREKLWPGPHGNGPWSLGQRKEERITCARASLAPLEACAEPRSIHGQITDRRHPIVGCIPISNLRPIAHERHGALRCNLAGSGDASTVTRPCT